MTAGAEVVFSYRQFWCWHPPERPDARDRRGDAGRPRLDRAPAALPRRFHRRGARRRPGRRAEGGGHHEPGNDSRACELGPIRTARRCGSPSSLTQATKTPVRCGSCSRRRGNRSARHGSTDGRPEADRDRDGGAGPTIAPGPAMPPEKPLAMPVQSLSRWSRAEERAPAASDPIARPGSHDSSSSAGRRRSPPTAPTRCTRSCRSAAPPCCSGSCSFLFTVNFSWIALAFTSALLGFVVALAASAAPAAAAGDAALADRRRDAGLQRIDRAHLRGARGDARGDRGDRARRAFRLFRAVGFDRSRRLDRRGARLPRLARASSAPTPASTTATGRRTITARPATSPISSRAGAAPTITCWCSTPTA